MERDDWNALASQWQTQPAPGDAALRQRVARYRRRHLWGLAAELSSTALALAMVVDAWRGALPVAMRPTLLVCGVIVIVWQIGYVLIRHANRLFAAPGRGVLGLIDAEIRRARYVIGHLWFGVLGGVLMVPPVLLLLPAARRGSITLGIVIATCLFLPYVIARTWTMVGAIRRLRRERSDLAGRECPADDG